MVKPVWSGLDHRIWKERQTWPKVHRILIALSGGVDSVALLSVFQRLASAAGFQLVAAYIHHGSGDSEAWRTQALEHCRELCLSLGVEFVHAGPGLLELRTESELRDFRYAELRRLRSELGCDLILTAHHADDLLETRLLRLLRGTGPLGLEALSEVSEDLWRPFLKISKEEIIGYVKENELKFIEDPSNNCLDPMRNWLRHDLLPHIELRQKGLVQNLGRSIQLLVESNQNHQDTEILSLANGNLGLDKSLYLSLVESEQRRILAKMLFQLGIRDYSQGQIKEIQKRLDNCQKVHSFPLASALWRVDAKQIQVEVRS